MYGLSARVSLSMLTTYLLTDIVMMCYYNHILYKYYLTSIAAVFPAHLRNALGFILV